MSMLNLDHSRRDFLRSGVAMAGLSLPSFFSMLSRAGTVAPKARSCIVLYTWGGMSHYESFDPKPDAPSDLRGEFKPISTATPGIQFCEHLPLLAKHSEKLAIVRSIHHKHGGHQQGMYVSLTGHDPAGGLKAKKRGNWPSLTAMISKFQDAQSGTPRAIKLPYSMYDNGTLMAGEYGGWLGSKYDPVLMKTPAGEPFRGVTRYTDRELNLKLNLKKQRISDRQGLLEELDSTLGQKEGSELVYDQLDHYRRMAADMLLGSPVRDAYDLEKEDPRVRAMYGDHICGQSLLLSRRLVEAGVPVVQALCSAGDLAGGGGDNWDTHRGHFPKMKDRLLPVFDRSVSALLTDLEQRGMLDETLVVFLTDFGRTPKINKNGGRDHHPGVYSVALAGGGIRGGQVYGSSDSRGAEPGSDPCSPADFHATIYTAMGIDPHAELHDQLGRPMRICDGNPLPLF
ncbi:MAG: DUF1501 domain-containing protein [Verrucomicrobiaceae bacterium]|nr:DUF1501 domain-containing protein [Verrucomicrobiaceae bacterium]